MGSLNQLLKKLREGDISKEELETLKEELGKDKDQLGRFLFSELETENTYDHHDLDEKRRLYTQTVEGIKFKKNRLVYFSIVAVLTVLVLWGVRRFSAKLPVSEILIINKLNYPKQVVLSDSSLVYLSPGSSLTCFSKFADTVRQVQLDGYAQFHVRSDKHRPFRVITSNSITEVIGTVFTINTLDTLEEVSLYEGSVAFSFQDAEKKRESKYLKAGERVRLHVGRSQQIEMTAISKEQRTDWKSGVLYFEKAGIHEIVSKLNQWYNIKINIDSSLNTRERLVYRVDTKKMSIDEVMSEINLVSNSYLIKRVKNDEYFLTRK